MPTPANDYRNRFLHLALRADALRFGEFTLKSGRSSPYFFNAGRFDSGAALAALAACYADALDDAGVTFDLLFGPAYKGIPLATALACEYARRGRDLPLAFNRKEAKAHGEGGSLIGAALAGRKVLIVDDVITAGTAIREALAIIADAGGTAAGIVIALDRQERVREDDGTAASRSSAAQVDRRCIRIARDRGRRPPRPACIRRRKRGTFRTSKCLARLPGALRHRLTAARQRRAAMPHLHPHPLAAAVLAGLLVGLLASTGANAQKAAEKKVYCWDDGGRRACSDALPAEAAGRARTEISARSGLATARVARALTDEEKAAATQTADAERMRMEADAIAKRRDLAIVESYMTETDLRRAYGERTALLDETIKASRLGIDNLRLSLMSQLRQAGDRELANEAVPKPMLTAIQQRHDDLLRQQRLLSDQMRDRTALDLELEDTLRRYRALKAPALAKPAHAASTTASTTASKPDAQR